MNCSFLMICSPLKSYCSLKVYFTCVDVDLLKLTNTYKSLEIQLHSYSISNLGRHSGYLVELSARPGVARGRGAVAVAASIE